MFSIDFKLMKSGSSVLSHMLSLLLFTLFATAATAQLPAGALACNNSIQVSLDDECEADITPAMILEGEDEDNLDAFKVSVSGINGSIVTVPGTYTVTVTNTEDGNSCWGYIHVEDKLAPQIEECFCPPGNTDPDCEFLCTDLDRILAGTFNTPDPVVEENCGGLTSDFSDVVTDGQGCGQKIVTRSWLFTDAAGNVASGCVQEFRLEPIDLTDVKGPTTPLEVPCGTNVTMPGLVSYYTPLVGSAMANMNAYPTVDGTPLTEAICNLVVTKSDVVIDVCEASCSNSIKVLRKWTVLDWCAGETMIYNQIIKAVDQEAPVVVAADITVSTDPWQCEGEFFLPAPTVLTDNCTSTVNYTVRGPAGVTITFNNAQGLWYAEGAVKGTSTFVYEATDCCGNIGTDAIQVTVVDRTAPIAVAKEFVTLTLTQGGIGKVFAPSIDNGSHDGCTDVHIEIRRDSDNCGVTGNRTYNNDGHPQDSNNDPDDGAFVKFCCADVNALEADVNGDGELDRGYIKVWMRVWDDGDMDGNFGSANDNYNETWAFVKVEDKLAPTITCPDNVTIQCDDDEDDLTLTGEATGTAACGNLPVDYTDTPNLDACGFGTITRRWFVESATQVRCTQIITKTGTYFNGAINWPSDYTTNCIDLNNNEDEPTWSAPPCAQIGYSLKSDTFTIELDACLKVINKWTVVDWCQYDPNTTSTAGIWTRTQVIKVLDDVAPVLTCSPSMFPVDENCELANPMLTAVANDNGDCSSKWLKWTALVDLYGDGTYDYEYSASLPSFDNSFNDTNGNGIPDRYLAPTSSGEEVKITLPVTIPSSMANHKIKWKVSDGCGNVSECSTTFMIVDKKAPTPYCISISSALMENGMVELWACDFDLGSFDNCTEQGDLRFTFTSTRPQQDPAFDSDLNCSAKAFTCDAIGPDGIGVVSVDVYVWDEKDLYDFCTVELTLLDNQGACGDGDANGRVAGTIVDPNGGTMANVDVTLGASVPELTRVVKSDTDGAFAFNNIATSVDYEITGKFDVDHRKGVNTLDIVLIQRHILGLQAFEDVYQTIAADITNDEKVSPADLLALRKLILGVTVDFPNQDSYRLLNAKTTYEDMFSPWPLAEEIALANMANEMLGQDLVIVKVGDVNRDGLEGLKSDKEIESRSKATLSLVSEQSESKTAIYATHPTNLAGMQMVLDLHGANVINITSSLLDISADMYHVSEGKLYISWAGTQMATATVGDELFAIYTTSKTDVTLTDSNVMNNEAYIGSELTTVNVEITPRAGEVETTYSFDLGQNEPNPFDQVTNFTYTLPTADNVQIEVYDLSGKSVISESVAALKGENTHTINMMGATPGLYYYSIKSGSFTATKKMILID